MVKNAEDDVRCEIVKGFTRDILRVAEKNIKVADFTVRNNNREGVPDDPESTRRIRLAFRRIRYQLKTMSTVDSSLGAEFLIGRLRDVGKPFGRLRDAEILESSVTKALGDRANTAQGQQLLDIAAHARRVEQQTTDHLLHSNAYQENLTEVSKFRRSLPSRHSTPETLRPLAERAMHASWRELRRSALKAKRHPSDANLHETRIAAKRTLYAAQALSDVLGASAKEFVRSVDAMQKYLGKQHDLAIASKWFTQVSKDYPALHGLARSLAREERRRADQRSTRWTKYWKTLEAQKATRKW
ncbi:MAG TPA: CHAD domain-containing protein [Acidimicrobiales bacterium]|jgi:CHAD domain-containing protein|nr:CHAD domain-containing protein [Acidimicrobiales bacterium]